MPFSDRKKAEKKPSNIDNTDSYSDNSRLITKNCKNKKDNAKTSATTLKDDLKNVIELMGPGTPQLKSTSEDESHSNNFSSYLCQAEKDEPPLIKREISPANTPRDYSDLSSIPTDTSEIFMRNVHLNDPEKIRIIAPIPSKREMQLSAINKLGQLFRFKNESKEQKDQLDLYTINILQPKNDNYPPKKVEFELITELPKPNQCNASTNTRPDLRFIQKRSKTKIQTNYNCYHCKPQQPSFAKPKIHQSKGSQAHYYNLKDVNSKANLKNISRVDVYYFDHGNSAYYQTTDSPPVIMAEILAEKTEAHTIRFWAEIFGAIHIAFSFFTSFILQLVRFVLQSLLKPLTVGILQLLSDYFFKPLLATLFNSVIQPPLIFIYNVASSLRDICDPVAEGLGYYLREISVLFSSIRFVDVKKEVKCSCNK